MKCILIIGKQNEMKQNKKIKIKKPLVTFGNFKRY
jgi:hypothetical protein